MTFRQKLLKAVYPAFMWLNKKPQKGILSNSTAVPKVSYTLNTIANDGSCCFHSLPCRKKSIARIQLLDCGLHWSIRRTGKLYQQYKHKLVVIGFQWFQRTGKRNRCSNSQFCKVNYGVSSPLMKKRGSKKERLSNRPLWMATNPAKNGLEQPGTLLEFFKIPCWWER